MRIFATLALCAIAVTAVAVGVVPIDVTDAAAISAAVVQASYSENIDAARAGMRANMNIDRVDTRICETEAGIGFGLAVSQGTGDKGAVIGGTLAGFSGITVRDVTLEPGDEDVYQEGANMGVLTEGDIWVVAAAAVSAGQVVHFNATTGALTNTGGQGPIVGARWMTSADQGGLAIVRLGGGMPAAAA